MGIPYQNTISGLIQKRTELVEETQILRQKLASAGNAIESIDRVLETLGFSGSLGDMKPKGKRILFFDRNELRKFLLDELRQAASPLSSREMAIKLIILDGKDPLDRRLLSNMVDRVGKAFRLLRSHGVVSGTPDKVGLMRWILSKPGLVQRQIAS